MVVEYLLGRIDHRAGDDRPGEVPLDKVLQAKEADLVELAAARLEVGVDVFRAGRICVATTRDEELERGQERGIIKPQEWKLLQLQ
jgi:hypothetical protein